MNGKKAKALRRIAREVSGKAPEVQTTDRDRFGNPRSDFLRGILHPLVQREHVTGTVRKNYKDIKRISKQTT